MSDALSCQYLSHSSLPRTLQGVMDLPLTFSFLTSMTSCSGIFPFWYNGRLLMTIPTLLLGNNVSSFLSGVAQLCKNISLSFFKHCLMFSQSRKKVNQATKQFFNTRVSFLNSFNSFRFQGQKFKIYQRKFWCCPHGLNLLPSAFKTEAILMRATSKLLGTPSKEVLLK